MVGDLSVNCNEYIKIPENIPEGYAYHRVVLDESGSPIDFVYLEVNSYFENLTGVSREAIIGKKFSEALPELMDDGFDYIGEYGRVALTGISHEFELYSKALKKWYSVFVFSEKYLHFAIMARDITERKNSLIELKKASALNEILLDAIPHPALLVRKDRSIIAANKKAKETGAIVGGLCWRDWKHCKYITEEDKKHANVFNPDSDENVCCSFCEGDKVLENNECINIKKELGGSFWNIYWLPTQEKDVYLHYSIDITEQVRAESELSESELRFKLLADASYEGICIHNNGIILDCNKMIESIFGYSADELIGMPLSNIVTSRIEEESMFAMRECYGIKKDGEKINIEILIRKMPYKGKKAEVFVIRDISKDKSMEQFIKKTKEMLNESQSMAHIGNVEMDFIEKKMYWSDEVFRIFGYQPQEFIPDFNSHTKHIFPEDLEFISNLISKLNCFDSSFKQEFKFKKLDGTEGWLSLKGDVGFNLQDFKPVRMVAIVQDITEKKQAELIYKSNEENIKLLEKAQELDRMKTELFANVSHEFRTPINIIFSTLQLLEMYIKNGTVDDSQDKLSKKLKSMKQNCYRLLRLIDNLIDVTKIDSGFISLQPENTDIIKVIKGICASVAEYTRDKNINLKYDANIDNKVIACDPDKIERIMLNLLSNAIKFNNPGGTVTVKIRTKKGNIQVSVEDNGVGIPKEKQKDIFDRFVQVDKSLSRKYEGSGIGLSLVKSFVDMHEGQLRLESEPGKGSKFIFTLPDILIETNDEDKTLKSNRHKDSNDFVEHMQIEFSDIYL